MLNSKMDFNNLLKVFVRAMLNTDKKVYFIKNATQKPQEAKEYLQTNNTELVELGLLKYVWLKQKRT